MTSKNRAFIEKFVSERYSCKVVYPLCAKNAKDNRRKKWLNFQKKILPTEVGSAARIPVPGDITGRGDARNSLTAIFNKTDHLSQLETKQGVIKKYSRQLYSLHIKIIEWRSCTRSRYDTSIRYKLAINGKGEEIC